VTALAALVAIVAILPPEGQQPARDTRPPIAGPAGTVSGIVVSAEAQPRPLRRARVTIHGPSLQFGRTAITKDDGTFAFTGLPAGRYTVAAMKDAYVTMNHGARRWLQPGTGIQLGAGETQSLTLRLPRGGVITGVVTDVDGQPAQGIGVTALYRRFVGPIGDRRLAPAGVSASPTDERGVYRIFGLPAGEYIVTAQSQMRVAGLPASGMRVVKAGEVSPRDLSLAPVFYPGTTDVARASRVTVNAGEERSGIDMQLQYVPMASVSGVVSVTPGTTPPSVTMARLGEIVSPEGTRSARADAEGRFTFAGIPPGQYILFARGPAQWASAEIAVDGDDITNVGLSMQPSLTIAGRLAFEGSRPAPDVAGVRLPFMPAGQTIGNFQIGLPQIQLEPGGRFVVAGIVPGAYRLGAMQSQPTQGIRTPIGGWWLKSIVVNGRDILDAPLDIRQGTDDAVATFTDQASELAGVVKDAQGRPASELFVVVFSSDRSSWFVNSRRVAGVRVDAEGRYTIRNLPPGEYRAVATADVEQGEWSDLTVLERLAAGATPLTIAGVEKKTVDLIVR
jgi:hypothetical protein